MNSGMGQRLIAYAFLLFLVPICWLTRLTRPRHVAPALVWAGVPIVGLSRSSKAMRDAGFDSIAIANDRYGNDAEREFDQVIAPGDFKHLPRGLRTLMLMLKLSWLFTELLRSRDIVHTYFDGGLFGQTPLREFELALWHQAGIRLILIPYGSDTFVYESLPETPWKHALMATYPHTPEDEARIRNQIELGTKYADAVVGCIVHNVCLPRVDYQSVLWYPAEIPPKPVPPKVSGPIRIAHAPNHRQIKGTDALIDATEALKTEGYDVDLDLIEGVTHDAAIERLSNADIVVDQLLFGYALTAIDAMAMGKVVITGVTDEEMYEPLRNRSHLNECPMFFASEISVKNVLRELLRDRASWQRLGSASREYVEKHHSPASTQAFFSEIYEQWG